VKPDHNHDLNRPWPWIVATVLTLPVLYVLSAGPAVWLCVNVLPKSTHDNVMAIYAPLEYVIPDSDGAAKIWIEYLTLWVDEDVLFQDGGP
jgi:uncharacterized membrane protein